MLVIRRDDASKEVRISHPQHTGPARHTTDIIRKSKKADVLCTCIGFASRGLLHVYNKCRIEQICNGKGR